jgi:hypothetical protein
MASYPYETVAMAAGLISEQLSINCNRKLCCPILTCAADKQNTIFASNLQICILQAAPAVIIKSSRELLALVLKK